VRVYPEKLAQHIEKSPAALYWIAGDEPLLVQEACDTARTAALKAGFTERKIFNPEKKEHWQEVIAEANALSLFADKCFLDIRTSTGKFDHTLLMEYLQHPNRDSFLLIRTDKVDSTTQKTQWFKAMEQACAFVPITPLDNSHFPAWLAERARSKSLNLSADALKMLADRTEGNLLAAVQELEKLALQFGSSTIGAEQIDTENNAHYDVFALNDALLSGNTPQALKILHTLRQEGSNALALLGALTRELRQLASASEAVAQGTPANAVMRQLGVWEKRQPVFQRALQRLTAQQTRQMIALMGSIDQAVKGMVNRDPWDALENLCLLICQPPHSTADLQRRSR